MLGRGFIRAVLADIVALLSLVASWYAIVLILYAIN